MFSGIVEEVGKVLRPRFSGSTMHLEIEAPGIAPSLREGASVCVSGVCFTVESVRQRAVFTATLSPHTQRETTLGRVKTGTPVNLEQALKVGDRLGGHILTGHADFCCPITAFDRRGDSVLLKIRIPDAFIRYVVRRGSIGIDGISLTVSETAGGLVSVWLVPYTLAHTNMQGRRRGDAVNVETDILARYVEKVTDNSTTCHSRPNLPWYDP